MTSDVQYRDADYGEAHLSHLPLYSLLQALLWCERLAPRMAALHEYRTELGERLWREAVTYDDALYHRVNTAVEKYAARMGIHFAWLIVNKGRI